MPIPSTARKAVFRISWIVAGSTGASFSAPDHHLRRRERRTQAVNQVLSYNPYLIWIKPTMQIALLQLSDIHIKTGQEPILSRADKIKDACHAAAPNATGFAIVLSGDVAFSGLAEQYDIAFAFLTELGKKLLTLPPVEAVEFIAVPGNHDCDFATESDIRQYLLQDIQALYESGIHQSSDRAKAILEVQKNFFTFEGKLAKGKEIGVDQRLNYARIVQFGNYSIRFQCYNTAWLSRKKELQSKLFLPDDAIEPALAEANICASVFHHPYNWLDSNNYRLLRDAVEQTSDIVFTGHEHEAGGGSVERFSGEHLHYLEAGALNGERGESVFSILVLDVTTGAQQLVQVHWSGDHYTSRESKSWAAIIKNPARERHLFKLNPEAMDQMTSPGATFTHPRKRNLRLDDFYVYLDLVCWSVQALAKDSKHATVSHSREVLGHFRETPRILITGPDSCGKSALLRKLFVDLSADYVPLLISGKDIGGRISETKFRSIVAAAVERQYDSQSVERFLQLDPSRRILLVDDFHRANLSKGNEKGLVALAQNMFGHIFIAAADLYRMRQLAGKDAGENPFEDFESCDIKQFGHRLRGQLISRWLSLGRDTASELEVLDYETRATEKVVDTLLGKSVVPALPFNIICLLHSMESAQPHAILDGSYGSLYELLIKASMSPGGGAGVQGAEVRSNYASLVAYAMFAQERTVLAEKDLRMIDEEYKNTFDYSPNFTAVISDLISAKVLERIDGNYSFKYGHVYFYFVARYFERSLKRQHPRVAELRSKLAYMADRLHNEEFANIVLFYLHLTQDWQLTQYIMAGARTIYAKGETCDLESHVEFVNKIYKEPPKMLIEDSDVERHREEYREALDEAEEREQTLSLDAKVSYSDDLDDLHKINIAFKTLQVLGQVLRSSADSMEGDAKLQITSTCYMLGLRTLRAFLAIAESNVEQFRLYLSSLIRERAAVTNKNLTERELLKLTDEAVIWLTFACAYGTVKKISYALGHPHLADTYDRILSDHPNDTAVRLVDLAIKLDHYPTVPVPEITYLRDKVVRNLFAYTLLRQLVGDFLYLYRTDVRTLQRLGSMFKIEGATGPKFLLPDDKIR
jgi:hypothetical protein